MRFDGVCLCDCGVGMLDPCEVVGEGLTCCLAGDMLGHGLFENIDVSFGWQNNVVWRAEGDVAKNVEAG